MKMHILGLRFILLSDLHFIENLIVMVTLIDEKGSVIGKQRHFYHKRPQIHYYAMNWILPGDGLYTIQVQIDASDLKWEGNMNDKNPPEIVEVEFPNILIQTGQHIS